MTREKNVSTIVIQTSHNWWWWFKNEALLLCRKLVVYLIYVYYGYALNFIVLFVSGTVSPDRLLRTIHNREHRLSIYWIECLIVALVRWYSEHEKTEYALQPRSHIFCVICVIDCGDNETPKIVLRYISPPATEPFSSTQFTLLISRSNPSGPWNGSRE